MANDINERKQHFKNLEGTFKYNRFYYDDLDKYVDVLYKQKLIDKNVYELTKNEIKSGRENLPEAEKELIDRVEYVKDKSKIHIETLNRVGKNGKPEVDVVLNDISSMDKAGLAFLEKKYNINSIVLNRYYESNKEAEDSEQFRYRPENYKVLLDVMEQEYGDLKNNKELSDLEKATLVAQRMMRGMEYDYDLVEVPMHDQFNGENRGAISRNLNGALLEKYAVCAGYSDLYKNAMSYIGIESKEITGFYNKDDEIKKNIIKEFRENPKIDKNDPISILDAIDNKRSENGHNWNQVKLNGKWYNIDLTAIQGDKSIVEEYGKHPYMFTSDKDFNETRNSFDKKEYVSLGGNPERADYSISNMEIDKAIKRVREYESRIMMQKREKKAKEDFRAQYRADGEYERRANEYSRDFNREREDVSKNTRDYEENERG